MSSCSASQLCGTEGSVLTRVSASLLALALIAPLSGCAVEGIASGRSPSLVTPSDSVGIFLPTHHLTAASGLPASSLTATLRVEEGCIWLVGADGVSQLGLWPGGTRLVATDRGHVTVELASGRRVAEGDVVTVGGGEYGRGEQAAVRELIAGPIPSRCDRGRYWLVGEVIDKP